MKILFIGAVEFSRSALVGLIGLRAAVVGVCTLQTSTFNADHSDLSDLCEANGIPWIYARDVNSERCVRWIVEKGPDVIFCFGWSRLIGAELLRVAPLGVIGFHPAALPANRGRHPLIWALALGLSETASTFFFMNEVADSGDILSQRRIEIADDDDAGMLYEKVTMCALAQIESFLPRLRSGSYARVAQDHRMANTWRKRSSADGQIDWRMSARSIHNLTRALAAPYVGAHFIHQEKEVKVWRTEIIDDIPANFEPGKIVSTSERGPVVRCGEQGVRLLKTEPMFCPAAGEYL